MQFSTLRRWANRLFPGTAQTPAEPSPAPPPPNLPEDLLLNWVSLRTYLHTALIAQPHYLLKGYADRFDARSVEISSQLLHRANQKEITAFRRHPNMLLPYHNKPAREGTLGALNNVLAEMDLSIPTDQFVFYRARDVMDAVTASCADNSIFSRVYQAAATQTIRSYPSEATLKMPIEKRGGIKAMYFMQEADMHPAAPREHLEGAAALMKACGHRLE